MWLLLIIIVFLIIISSNTTISQSKKFRTYYANQYKITNCESLGVKEEQQYNWFGKVRITLIRKHLFRKDEVLTIEDFGKCCTFSTGPNAGAVIWGIGFNVLQTKGYSITIRYEA